MHNINWKPDKSSKVPVYKQIIIFIKEKIASGEWPVGTILPSQRSLASAFEVNRSTVTYAIEDLISLAILAGDSRIGTRVINNTWNLLSSTAQSNWNFYIQSGMHLPNQTLIQKIETYEFAPSIIKLGTQELSPELLPDKGMNQIICNLPDKINSFGYGEPKGLFFLREMLSNYFKHIGIDVTPDSILIVSGSLQALHLISVGLMKTGSTIFVEKPSYLYSLNLFQSLGMRLHGLPMDNEGIQANRISNDTGLNSSLLYTIPSFQNPTGTLMSTERRKELITVCQRKQIPIIEDAAYSDLWFEEPPPLPLKSIDKSGLVLYIGSTSRVLGSGFRVGWVIGPEPVIDRLADIKMQTDYGTNNLAQQIIAESLSSGFYEQHLQLLRKNLKDRRNKVLQILEHYFSDLATWQVPAGGCFIWLCLNFSIPMKNLFEKALSDNILINPGSLYYPGINNHIRISYSYATLTEMEEGLYRLSNIIRKFLINKINGQAEFNYSVGSPHGSLENISH